jgi:hypothetical protein
VVGRYCLFHGDDEDYTPPPEPVSVRERRRRLLATLAEAAAAVPGSGWVSGQRVRYLLEAGRGEEARAVARACRAAGWWCRALEGFVLQRTGRPEAAERAFDAALVAMDRERRRRWEDVSPLLDGDAADSWDRARWAADAARAGLIPGTELEPGRRGKRGVGEATPVTREELAARLWWLSDPLYLVPGNERRAAHLARRVENRLLRDAAGPFGIHRAGGLAELHLRYGPPVGYARERRSLYDPTSRPRVTGYHDPDALRFVPSPDRLLDPLEPGAEGWRLDDPRPRSAHAPSYADTIRHLAHDVVLFPRGDSVGVAVVYAAGDGEDGVRERDGATRADPGDGAADADVEALLYLGRSGRAVAEARARRGRGALLATVPAWPHLLSVEVLSRAGRWAERSRAGLDLRRRPEGVPGLSGVLLAPADGSDAPPASLEDAVARAPGPDAVLRPGEPVDLYWEMYGPARLLRGTRVTVGLADADGGWLRRLAGTLGIGDGGGVAGVGWRDRVEEGSRLHPRALRFRIPSGLEPGEYELAVTVRVPGHDPLTSRRTVRIREGG